MRLEVSPIKRINSHAIVNVIITEINVFNEDTIVDIAEKLSPELNSSFLNNNFRDYQTIPVIFNFNYNGKVKSIQTFVLS